MKTSKDARNALIELATNSPEISQDESIEILRKYGGVPDTEVLIHQEYARTVNRILSTIEDLDGARIVFGIRGDEKQSGTHVNINLSDDTNKIHVIISRLEKQKTGIEKSISKAKKRARVIEGQISLDDIFKLRSDEL